MLRFYVCVCVCVCVCDLISIKILIDIFMLLSNRNIDYVISDRGRTNPRMMKINGSVLLFIHLKCVKICIKMYTKNVEKTIH